MKHDIYEIKSISPIDGRYHKTTKILSGFFSEFALIKARVKIEIEFLIKLSDLEEFYTLGPLTQKEKKDLRLIVEDFSDRDALAIKTIEKEINHDVKAIEYFLRKKIDKKYYPALHFGLTSEDINNLSYSILIRGAVKDVLTKEIKSIIKYCNDNAIYYKSLAFPARTHGQTASPSTLGKEFLVFSERLKRQLNILKKQEYLGKLAGATGNFSAMYASYPDINWIGVSCDFVESFGLKTNIVNTQIESHDFIAEICDCLRRINIILLDLSQDFWRYISDGFFIQKKKENEVGSSTMPHKVNPIDFENAEGNFGIANSLFGFFSRKLPISRMQRDLSDSTVFRNIGMSFAYTILAFSSLQRGLVKISIDKKKIQDELENSWEVLAEPIQTILRREGFDDSYEKLKKLSRGKKIDKKCIEDFCDNLNVKNSVKKEILDLSPKNYIGLAREIVDYINP